MNRIESYDCKHFSCTPLFLFTFDSKEVHLHICMPSVDGFGLGAAFHRHDFGRPCRAALSYRLRPDKRVQFATFRLVSLDSFHVAIVVFRISSFGLSLGTEMCHAATARTALRS